MNHRLDELFVRAGGQFGHYGEPILPDIEVFAELIVKECAKISLECGINLNREDFRQGIARNIKEHFGVK
jgi:hypothetical protein